MVRHDCLSRGNAQPLGCSTHSFVMVNRPSSFRGLPRTVIHAPASHPSHPLVVPKSGIIAKLWRTAMH